MRERFEPVTIPAGEILGWKYEASEEPIPDEVVLTLAKAGYLCSEGLNSDYDTDLTLTLTPRHGLQIEVSKGAFVLMTKTGRVIYVGNQVNFVYEDEVHSGKA